MNAEQMEFIRRHGITKCPPGPVYPVSWHRRGSRQYTETDAFRDMAATDIMVEVLGVDFTKPKPGKK